MENKNEINLKRKLSSSSISPRYSYSSSSSLILISSSNYYSKDIWDPLLCPIWKKKNNNNINNKFNFNLNEINKKNKKNNNCNPYSNNFISSKYTIQNNKMLSWTTKINKE